MEDELDREETKKCRKCKMDIPVDAVKCPYCRSSQKPVSVFKIFLWVLVLLAIAYGGWYAFNQKQINSVKKAYLTNLSSTVTVGDALDSFFSNPKWKYGKDSEGNEIVTVTGGCTYYDQPAEATIQFTFLEGGEYFVVSKMKINGKDLGLSTDYVFASLFKKALELF